MPSKKVLEQKKQIVAQLIETLKDSCAGVIVDYKGISVADDTKLRSELREAGIKYEVVKNKLLSLAVKEADLEDLDEVLVGSTALATSTDDHVAAARILSKYADSHKHFNLKSGFLDGEVISLEVLSNLAKLPSRDVLLATVCSAFNAPIAALARAIQAIVDKEDEGDTQEEEATQEEETTQAEEVAQEEAPKEEAKEETSENTEEKTEA
ncbi:MAG: 50S ribosomal protein L10 [Clostridiales bacterium]|nr:50S ribosomal protein L10 [Clostridiales bacterium]